MNKKVVFYRRELSQSGGLQCFSRYLLSTHHVAGATLSAEWCQYCQRTQVSI